VINFEIKKKTKALL